MWLCLLSWPAFGQWVTGYYPVQSVQPVSAIPWNNYTYIIQFAAAPGPNGTVDLHYLNPARIRELLSARPDGKKVMVSLMDGETGFKDATSPENLDRFVGSIAEFVNQYGYDGVDIDWERDILPGQFEKLIRRLRDAMPVKVITMAGSNYLNMPDVAMASQAYLDQINIMCYDMDSESGRNCHGSECTWYNNALLQGGELDKHACEWRIRPFLAAGVAPSKIGVGIPFYGRRYVGATRPWTTGKLSRYTVFYRDLVADQERWKPAYQRYDTVHEANYLSIEPLNEFITYTGTQFIADTVRWMNAAGFGGIMEFSTECEYLSGQIGDARYPLSTAVREQIYRQPRNKNIRIHKN